MEIWISALNVIVGILIGITIYSSYIRKEAQKELVQARELLAKSVADISRVNNSLAETVNVLQEKVNAHEMRFSLQMQNPARSGLHGNRQNG